MRTNNKTKNQEYKKYKKKKKVTLCLPFPNNILTNLNGHNFVAGYFDKKITMYLTDEKLNYWLKNGWFLAKEEQK